jgi:hypothetical protein
MIVLIKHLAAPAGSSMLEVRVEKILINPNQTPGECHDHCTQDHEFQSSALPD